MLLAPFEKPTTTCAVECPIDYLTGSKLSLVCFRCSEVVVGALHHIGLEVAPDDYERERQRLIGLGFAIRGGEHPFMPVDAFYLDDPDGNEIEIATWRE